MILNNIISISSVPSQLITGFRRTSETDAVISKDVTFTPVEYIKRPAQLVISDKIENGNRIYTAKLTFQTCVEWMADTDRLAFLCRSIDGKYYLIGTDERPYPIVTQQQVHPKDYSESQLTEVSVSYSAPQICPIIKGFV